MSSSYKLNRTKSFNNFNKYNVSYPKSNIISLTKSNSLSKFQIKNNIYCFSEQNKIQIQKSITKNNKKISDKKGKKNIKNANKSRASTKDSSFDYSVSKNNSIYSNTSININFDYCKKNFCNYIPKKGEFSDMCAKKPLNFPCECFHGINLKHNEIGSKNFLNLKDKNIFNNNSNDSYKIIDKKDHILINHLCQKTINKKIINSFTIKYRLKNTTFLYFK